MRLLAVAGVAIVLAIAAAVSVPIAVGTTPPPSRIARLERKVATLTRQLAAVQSLALGTAQEVQAGHDAFDRVDKQVAELIERVTWLEARVDKLEGH